jgi:hypothetical protein
LVPGTVVAWANAGADGVMSEAANAAADPTKMSLRFIMAHSLSSRCNQKRADRLRNNVEKDTPLARVCLSPDIDRAPPSTRFYGTHPIIHRASKIA